MIFVIYELFLLKDRGKIIKLISRFCIRFGKEEMLVNYSVLA